MSIADKLVLEYLGSHEKTGALPDIAARADAEWNDCELWKRLKKDERYRELEDNVYILAGAYREAGVHEGMTYMLHLLVELLIGTPKGGSFI